MKDQRGGAELYEDDTVVYAVRTSTWVKLKWGTILSILDDGLICIVFPPGQYRRGTWTLLASSVLKVILPEGGE